MNFMPPRHPRNRKVEDQYRIPKPKSAKEIPHYIKSVVTSFFSRLTYIMKLIWEARKSLLFVMLVVSVFNGITPLISSLIGREIVNNLVKAYNSELSSFSVITVLIVSLTVFTLLNSLVGRFYRAIIRISGEIVTNYITLKIMRKAGEIDVCDFDDPEFYSKMENASREVGNRPIQVMEASFSVISNIISIISFIIVLFSVSWAAPIIIIVASVPAAIINFLYRKKTVEYMNKRSLERRQMSYYRDVLTSKDYVKEIRMYNLTDTLIGKYNNVFGHYYKGMKKLVFRECVWSMVANILFNFAYCVIFIFAAIGVYNHDYQVGDFTLYENAIMSISTGISAIITTSAQIYEGTLFINNLITFLKEERRTVPMLSTPRKVEKHIGHSITFDNVCFSYPGTDREVLHNINVTLSPAETVVIVGLNGAGKTTFLKLLTRLYDPTSGRVLLDGHDIREYDVQELYSMFGIIFQDFGKYAVSVKENIAFGDIYKDMTKDNIQKASDLADASDFIDKLPNKYDTSLMKFFDENGIELSIGQWQKLSIARAFYSDSDILILDEPTASLDPLAEQEIYNQFDSLRKGKTSIFVSHRLSCATTADKIIVLENGGIIETGTHKELMQKRGKYYELFSTQAKRYVEIN